MSMQSNAGYEKAKQELKTMLETRQAQLDKQADDMSKASSGTDPRIAGVRQAASEVARVLNFVNNSMNSDC